MKDSELEAMCAAWWDVHATVPWGGPMPQDKEHYRENMRAAVAVIPKLTLGARGVLLRALRTQAYDYGYLNELTAEDRAELAAIAAARAELEALP